MLNVELVLKLQFLATIQFFNIQNFIQLVSL